MNTMKHLLKNPVTEADRQTGNPHAKITLVEYGDYECPYCGVAHPLIKRLLNEMDGMIRFVFRNFPLQNVHPYSLPAALSAEAAAHQNRFWPMHDFIYEHQEQLSDELFPWIAKRLKLDLQLFQMDINRREIFDKVEADFQGGLYSGVNGTPSFFINGVKAELPDLSYEALRDVIVKESEFMTDPTGIRR